MTMIIHLMAFHRQYFQLTVRIGVHIYRDNSTLVNSVLVRILTDTYLNDNTMRGTAYGYMHAIPLAKI
jgi:hypothetical protein